MASHRQVPSSAPSKAVHVDTTVHTSGSGTVGMPPMLPQSVCNHTGSSQSVKSFNVNLMRGFAREVSNEVFHLQIFNSIDLDDALWTFLDFSDVQRAVQRTLKNAISARGSLATYLHSLAGANLSSENIHH